MEMLVTRIFRVWYADKSLRLGFRDCNWGCSFCVASCLICFGLPTGMARFGGRRVSPMKEVLWTPQKCKRKRSLWMLKWMGCIFVSPPFCTTKMGVIHFYADFVVTMLQIFPSNFLNKIQKESIYAVNRVTIRMSTYASHLLLRFPSNKIITHFAAYIHCL